MNRSLGVGWSNAEWLGALQGAGPHSFEAPALLHAVLRNGLRRAFASRPDVLNWIEDFAQEAAIRILRDLGTFRGESSFTTWALSIAVRVSFDELRKRRWRDVSLDALIGSGEHYDPAAAHDLEKELARRRAFDVLHRAIRSDLSEKQRTALLAELKGMPQSEIARQLGSSRNAVYKLTHDARKVLKRILGEAGITPEAIGWAFAEDRRNNT
jgi:RNA polymerase sigma-70 factor (ECF subfamily)